MLGEAGSSFHMNGSFWSCPRLRPFALTIFAVQISVVNVYLIQLVSRATLAAFSPCIMQYSSAISLLDCSVVCDLTTNLRSG